MLKESIAASLFRFLTTASLSTKRKEKTRSTCLTSCSAATRAWLTQLLMTSLKKSASTIMSSKLFSCSIFGLSARLLTSRPRISPGRSRCSTLRLSPWLRTPTRRTVRRLSRQAGRLLILAVLRKPPRAVSATCSSRSKSQEKSSLRRNKRS